MDVIYHFNETCCEANGVSPGCMDLCREVEARKDILPISKCVQHQDTIESCLIAEGKTIYIQYDNKIVCAYKIICW